MSYYRDPFSSLPEKRGGFTLLELLIVIAILAILAAVVILVLNPAETLRETRDSQRLSDVATIKTVLGLYLTSTSTPFLGSNTTNIPCRDTPTATRTSVDRIFYSADGTTASTSDPTLDGGSNGAPSAFQVATANLRKVDATGWIPVNLSTLSSGSPIDSWPLDPTNTITTLTAITNSDLVYRYVCSASPLLFEIDVRLEAIKNTTTMSRDGGNNDNLYESGTDLRILDCSAGNDC